MVSTENTIEDLKCEYYDEYQRCVCINEALQSSNRRLSELRSEINNRGHEGAAGPSGPQGNVDPPSKPGGGN